MPDGKQPYYFSRVDRAPITVAGLWAEWKDIETGEPLKSCTMIITTANEFTSDTHDRMPVILEAGAFSPLAVRRSRYRVASAGGERRPSEMAGLEAGEQLA